VVASSDGSTRLLDGFNRINGLIRACGHTPRDGAFAPTGDAADWLDADHPGLRRRRRAPGRRRDRARPGSLKNDVGGRPEGRPPTTAAIDGSAAAV